MVNALEKDAGVLVQVCVFLVNLTSTMVNVLVDVMNLKGNVRKLMQN